MKEERQRLLAARDSRTPWKKWGPYLAEREWGTVREDASEGHDTWNAFTHDQARSRAYRWGEDGLAGISDDQQRLCFALALWNGADPILKERLFGLTNGEGNHGEDVKEYYFYLDSTPTHSYMRYLYKYPQSAYPYDDLRAVNRRRSRRDVEYELLDTGIFDADRYFDVEVEYAKAAPEDVLIRVTATNRGPEAATLHVLPTLWFRNTWSWGDVEAVKPQLVYGERIDGAGFVDASHVDLGDCYLYFGGKPEVLFTENETNVARLCGIPNPCPWVKDAFHEHVVHGRGDAVNPARVGTKAAAHYPIAVEPRQAVEIRLRLTVAPPDAVTDGEFGKEFEDVFTARRREADEFYADLTPPSVGPDAARVMRQALAGMMWNKEFYDYDLARWLEEHGVDPYLATDVSQRNAQWAHMVNADVISMPDTWEYPWYAAWDLAFHALALNVVDPDFAKDQLLLVLDQRYLHPSGQIPAYEWNFGDVNPPVHAWAAWCVYQDEKAHTGEGDIQFLETVFQRLLVNFTWWVNRKDPEGRNVFEGGFLGLDNIGLFDRNVPLPTGGRLEQADGRAWMAFFCQTMLQLAVELALHDPAYQNVAAKFYDHFLWIGGATDRRGRLQDLWDETDGFFYDVLRLPTGNTVRLKVRSMMGLLSICASTVFPMDARARLPVLMDRLRESTKRRAPLLARIASPTRDGCGNRRLLSLLTDEKLRRVLGYMLDEDEFLAPFGIRAVSRYHRDHPYTFTLDGVPYSIDYEPGESTNVGFGGNANWRGPVWFPVNVLIVRALVNLYAYYGNEFTVECPTGSGVRMNLFEVAREIAARLTRIFLRDEGGRRPVFGGARKFQSDPDWRDLLLFYEYFHGDNGAGLGASHQTGWTGLVAPLIQFFGRTDAETILRAPPARHGAGAVPTAAGA
jgi:hypothetical protein